MKKIERAIYFSCSLAFFRLQLRKVREADTLTAMKKGTMTAKQFAEEIGAAYSTVNKWLRKGLIPGAELQEDARGPYWEIPLKALKTFSKPKKGRPRKGK